MRGPGTTALVIVALTVGLGAPGTASAAPSSGTHTFFPGLPGGRTHDTVTLRADCVPTGPNTCEPETFQVSLAIDNPLFQVAHNGCPAIITPSPFGTGPCDVVIAYVGPASPTKGMDPDGTLTTGTVSRPSAGSTAGPTISLVAWFNQVSSDMSRCKKKKSKKARKRCRKRARR